mgnify:FL=1
MDLKSFTSAIQQIAEEKGIPREKIFETIEMALAAAYKRDYGKRGQIIRAKLDPESGGVSMTQIKIAVDESMLKPEEEDTGDAPEIIESPGRGRRYEPEDEEISAEKKVRFNPEKHLMLDEAKKVKPDAMPGDELIFPVAQDEVAGYGRIAAQTAKQVILQRIREAEREAVFDEYKDKEGELTSGMVQRVEGRNVFVDIGRSAGMLPPEEQIPGEHYRIGERIKVLIALVEKNPRGPGVFLSRTHPRLLKKLFELEVPEIATGSVEIKAVAREPGSRSKVAAVSHEQGVDPVGSLVGQKGVRVSTVIQELGGEKIDIISWSDDPKELIAHALSPAKVIGVEINEHRHDARATVPEDQLSLAIGKRGQNVRLAAKLTGWKIDVRPPYVPPEEDAATEQETAAPETGETEDEQSKDKDVTAENQE